MRAPAAAAIAMLVLASRGAVAEPLPPGSVGMWAGLVSGTGADAGRLGQGFQWGGAAAWQPMNTEQRLGWSAKTSFALGQLYDGSAPSVGDKLATMQIDFEVGIRIRPGVDPYRYLTLRGGVELLRANQVVPPKLQRAFVGAVGSIGVDQYLFGSMLLAVDVRVSQIGTGPTTIALMFGVGLTGP
ncbi:MAG: hypothetical protein KF773_21920 [Deltaproteobacteria bacterium]|nr:hypothetical protein [Deltaproteobacteria bacterium]MCW5802034.1 hypothetical protein [Deltaproteobacteria bacterium]